MSLKFRKQMAKMKKKLGFSLIEMLVVIAIIAILVSIITPVINKSVQKANAATNAANLRAIEGKIAVLRASNPEIFDEELRNGMGYNAFISFLDNSGFSDVTKTVLFASLLINNTAANNYMDYHIFNRTADDNDIITLVNNPLVQLTDVPRSVKVSVENMEIPKDCPMTVYISDTAIVASYEVNGYSYNKYDFGYVAEHGRFDGQADSISGSGVLDDLTNAGNCLEGNHVFEEGSCVCIHCNITLHPGHNKDESGTCTRCGNPVGHYDLGNNCRCEGCGWPMHDYDTTGHTCTNCGTDCIDAGTDTVCDTCGGTITCKHERNPETCHCKKCGEYMGCVFGTNWYSMFCDYCGCSKFGCEHRAE